MATFHHNMTAGAKESISTGIPFVWVHAPKNVSKDVSKYFSKDFSKAVPAEMVAMESQLTENTYISS